MDAAQRELWRQADRILDELIDLPHDTRRARLAALASQPALLAHVQRLLAAHDAGTGPLEQPLPIALMPDARDALSGRQLGRWRLLQEVGRGGMSVVYRAVADEGAAGQIAAVKVLTLGALAEQGRERFLQEQQALLRLRHPYLATLYDAGVADDGTPWLAMALVEGERIDAWCERHALEVPARVRLLLQACGALAYAHRSLVIHRDIKPSNVLVDDDGHVRVLDFGIARLIDGTAERTATAMRALTPEYAAPEQFAGAAPSTAVDVYGLGALLYRLLAEQPPRSTSGLQGPPTQPPSGAVRNAAQLAATERRQRMRQLRGDLDTVVMKALAERPEDRYPSIEALADDLQRWLDRRPVRARAPSWRYRFARLLARHRLAAAASALLLCVLVAGVASTLWQARLARQEAARAQLAVEESNAQLAYLDSVLEMMTPSTEQARERDQRELLAEIGQRARREFADRPELLAKVELSLGGIAARIGDYEQAADLYAASMGRRRAAFGLHSAQAGEARLRWAAMLDLVEAAEPIEAERQLRASVATLRRTLPGSPLLAEALIVWSNKLADHDRYGEAQQALAQADSLCRSSGLEGAQVCEQAWVTQSMLAHRTGRPAQAIEPLQTLLAIRQQRYGREDARTVFVLSGLGKSYAYSGQRERGLAMMEQAYALQQRIYRAPTRETLHTTQTLSTLLGDMGQHARALELGQRGLEQAKTLFGEQHETVAVAYADLGTLMFADGRYQDAAASYERSRATYAHLYGPDHAGAMIALGNYADALRELDRAAEALPLQQRALATMERLFGPDSPRVAGRVTSLARIELALGRPARALTHFDRSIAIYRRHASSEDYRPAVVGAYRSQALLALRRHEEALQATRSALQTIAAALGREHRFYWEALALHAHAACTLAHPDCAPARVDVLHALAHPQLPGGPRAKLESALASAAR